MYDLQLSSCKTKLTFLSEILRSERLKRIIDITGAIFGLIIFSPLLIPACILIRLSGCKEIIFRQERVGKDGKFFTLYKLTTMNHDAHLVGPLVSKANDARITKAGKIIRMFSLNELPQFINVLKGEMSIVGPRPETPKYVKYWPKDLKDKVLSIKPGITGYGTIKFWQEGNILNDKKDPEKYYIECIIGEKLKLESWYVDNWNLLLDLKIMVQTIFKAFNGERKVKKED